VYRLYKVWRKSPTLYIEEENTPKISRMKGEREGGFLAPSLEERRRRRRRKSGREGEKKGQLSDARNLIADIIQ
jgi:hypothetical protein